MNTLYKAAAAATGALALGAAYRRLSRIDLEGRTVLITGGSRGLGLELARVFLRHGARLALLARDHDELEAARADLGAPDILLVEADVRSESVVNRVVEEVVRVRGPIDVLVNDAGVIDVSPFEHLDDADFADSLDTHLWGPLHLIRAAVEHMKPGARIVNISSIGGLVSIPHLLSYSVGKFALTGLSEGLHAELSTRGIAVTTVCPGLMRTGSHVQARFKGRQRAEFAWFAAGAGLPLVSMNAERAARKIVNACREGRPFLILTPQARALHLMRAVMPNVTARVMSAVARALPGPTAGGHRTKKGWRSTSRAAPSILTKLADQVISRNNELDPVQRRAYGDD